MGSLPATTEARRFGKYTLVAKLATGGMAEIYLARLSGAAGFEKLVCIKKILPHLARNKQFVSMFLDEAKIASRISHPNVCQVFELGELDGTYYIAMEYLQGVPLACFRRRDYYGPAPDPQLVAGIVVQACEGLHHAHNLKTGEGLPLDVVHRDISPQNLFVTVDGVVKVLDFGIAKIQDASVKTSTGAVKGTYAYMAPEQLRGERVDRRADIWAMGIVMWETLTRRHLFKRETDFLTFNAITTEPIPDILDLRPDVGPELAAVIRQALQRDRDARIPTARALAEMVTFAVLPLGGPLSPSAISDEIQESFGKQITEQAELVRAARDGELLDLEEERGPMVGHGAELLTTPVSNQIVPRPRSTQRPFPIATPMRPPVPRQRRRTLRALALYLATVIVCSGAFVAYWFLLRPRPSTPTAAAEPPSPPAATASTTEPPPKPAAIDYNPRPVEPAPALTPDAAPAPTIAEAPDAGVHANEPDEPAVVKPVIKPDKPDKPDKRDKPVIKPDRPDKPDKPDRPDKPDKPDKKAKPGYITIESTPDAQIFIDGKPYGETPLVKIELAPGKHAVRAVSKKGKKRDSWITIESGKASAAHHINW
ncbi:MAG TPA: protein kinase [Kofleriaceae bacterium]|nr:protein kinase [Kofleriaceae bacterium]